MRRCFFLAAAGLGHTAPNPLVGSVIVHDNKIIGEGYHQKYGESHAEVNAINSVQDTSKLKEATLYVNLEPCAHHGKTPPCAELIVRMGIPRVVISNRDPFEAVDGKGIELLSMAGVEVVLGVLEEEGKALNRRFFTFHLKKRPYVILKWAQSIDGFIDRNRVANQTGPNWISHPNTRKLVHRWRSEVQAIAVGAKTIINDDPELTVRDVFGQQPLRVIIDPEGLVTNLDYRVFNDVAETIIIGGSNQHVSGWKKVIPSEGEHRLASMLSHLYSHGIQSVMIEGGAFTLRRFIEQDIWDEARVISGRKRFSEGLPAPNLPSMPSEEFSFGSDLISIWRKS